MKAVQVHVYYCGTVQGVGFRYQVRNVAARFPVAGWVRNLPDGRVELLAEAEKRTLLDFMSEIDDSLNDYIRDRQISWDKAENSYKGFQITF